MALRDFRGILAPLIQSAEKQDAAEQASLLLFFEGGESLQIVLTWEPKEFFVRFVKKVAPEESFSEEKVSTAKVLGTVMEGPEQAHVVTRAILKLRNVEISRVNVMTFRLSGGDWKVMPSEWQELAESIKLSLSQHGVSR